MIHLMIYDTNASLLSLNDKFFQIDKNYQFFFAVCIPTHIKVTRYTHFQSARSVNER
jgi:hypothetical protein